MLDVGLCMTVRNEAANIVDCLAPIASLFAEIVVIDTGSSDDTQVLVEDVLGIRTCSFPLEENQCLALATARNHGFDRLTTPWLMTLDADERLDRAELEAVFGLSEADLPDGLFCRWDTDYGDGTVIEDYKLNLFRRSHRHRGLIHDTAQPSLRSADDLAAWMPLLRIRHRPDPLRRDSKRNLYSWRLACARRREPNWLRYDWFSGYMAFQEGNLQEAERLLRKVHHERPHLFPVESLNASMVLASIYARLGHRPETLAVLDDALKFYGIVADDFEVAVNSRLMPWLRHAHESAAEGALSAIVPYPFPY